MNETWLINESPTINYKDDLSWTIGFTSANESFSSFVIGGKNALGTSDGILYGSIQVFYNSPDLEHITGWTDSKYRTIILSEPASGSFLEWLQANATKQ